ncbi:hypothetical protein L6452_27754 [Arctium lappa]|uniref:Uncharacterized protein n=1 Tax=Arctium lappa TaxID=4217 RepID=A0ACB8ZXJ4_ARCLA|nr:hypothetical protein L6452_27754 [Arctium lappa]
MMTALGLRKSLRFPDKSRNGFDALPTDAELIQFLDAMEYAWEPKPRTTIPNKKLTLVKKALMPSQLNYIFSHIIQCMSGKMGQRSQEVKTLPNEVSISELRSRLSLLTSSSSAATQEVPSSAIPAATPSKRPSVGSPGPSKKAKVTKEKSSTSSRPKDASQQTSLDAFVCLSSTSPAIPTSTVPATTVAVTTTVTPPIVSVPPPPEVTPTVTTPIPTSIPVSRSSISLISNPPSISTQPQFEPIGPEHQSFEESLQFYKMFDNSGIPITLNTSTNSPYKPVFQQLTYISGPSLANVDTNVNNLSAKLEALTASLNNTTSAVQTAADALKTLTDNCASKADVSQLATLQEAIVKVREDSKQQFDDLSTKVDACTSMLQQILDQLKAPAPVPAPSFSENDHTALNIAVEFIHQATSEIPEIEVRLKGLEAEVQKLSTAETSTPSKDLSLCVNDKEGEKESEENKEKEAEAEEQLKDTPSHVEGEEAAEKAPPSIADLVDDEEEKEQEDDDEALDLEDQEEEPHQDDDDDDEEDQSLWCSSAVTSSAIASKGVIKAGERQEKPSETPSQSKGSSAEGTLKMISLPEENPSQFSPLLKGKELQIIPAIEADDLIIPVSVREIDEEDEEEEESLQHHGRPSRPSHWSEEERKKRTEMISVSVIF